MNTPTSFARQIAAHCMAALILSALPATALTATPKKTVRARPEPHPGQLFTIEWDALLPDSEYRTVFNLGPPPPAHDYLNSETGPAAAQSGSTNTRGVLNGVKVKIPGFIVPLSITTRGVVKEFFLVPYLGACIHVPPPPPNQLVYVSRKDGFVLKSLYNPYWITGTLRTQSKDARLGVAGYSMDADTIEPFGK
jgi:uncharacterized protein